MPTAPTRRPRRDAVRNRSLLVEAAARAFREQGLGASVNAIARDAGVNVATLYRHFPTKEDLLDAVFEAILEPLAAARDHALEADDADDGPLRTFVHEAVRLQRRQPGLIEALAHHPVATEVREQLRGPAVDIVTPLVERAHRDGELRPDFDAVDVLIALRMLAAVPDAPEVAARGGAGRYADIVLGGLRPA
jgi:AcrR family transcriptional regulator